jgi:hypothetical protein
MSFFVADIFMTVFESAVSTIFICFCEDLDRNNGKSSPYFMSESLRRIIEHHAQLAVGDSEKPALGGGF